MENLSWTKVRLGIVLFFLISSSNAELFPNESSNQFLKITLPKYSQQEEIIAETTERKEQLVSYINEKYALEPEEAEKIVNHAQANANKHALDPELILAIIAVESTYNHQAKSHMGALGLMQVIPKWHKNKLKNFGGDQALYDVPTNINVGTQILVEYLGLSKGNLTKALLRYNGSYNDKTEKYAKKVFREYNKLKLVNADDIAVSKLDEKHQHTQFLFSGKLVP